MQKIIIALVLFFALLSNCRAEWSEWKDQDKYLFVASEVAMLADWSTTRYATRHWDPAHSTWHETNGVLGHYPSTQTLDLYMLTMMVSNYYIADFMSDKDNTRSVYLTVRTMTHGYAAHHNLQVGWRMRF